MHLYFLRHATAEDRPPGGSDRRRRLTPHGREEADAVGRALAACGVAFDRILTSPYPRAVETAERVAAALGLAARVEEEPRLASGCAPGTLLDLAAALPANGRILLVGHQPDLGYAIGLLIGGGALRITPGTLACVDLPYPHPGQGELCWLLLPELAHLLAPPG